MDHLPTTSLLTRRVPDATEHTPPGAEPGPDPHAWPGQQEGLTERESEVVLLITRGHSNVEIGKLMYLSVNSIKSYIRVIYRKIGVSNRPHAVLWGADHGFLPWLN